ncbi:MAG: DUF3106 domain-containing protein [Acidobacteriota bacterium]
MMRFLIRVALYCVLLGTFVPADAQLLPRAKGKAKGQQGIIDQKQLKQQKQAKQADVVERFLQMSPEDRERALAQLSPDRRRQILRRLRAVELLSDDERKMLRGRLQAFSGMPPDRQEAVRAELQTLRSLSPPERRRRMTSDEIRNNFSDEERQLLFNISGPPPAQEE